MTHISNIIKAVSFFKKTSLNKNKFYLCFVYFTIYFLFRSIFFSRFGTRGEGWLILQWALCAAALHGGLHLLRKGGSVGALEADLPSPALGGSAAQARAAGAWTPSDFTGGGAVFMTHITLEQLTDHLSLARRLCVEEGTEDRPSDKAFI